MAKQAQQASAELSARDNPDIAPLVNMQDISIAFGGINVMDINPFQVSTLECRAGVGNQCDDGPQSMEQYENILQFYFARRAKEQLLQAWNEHRNHHKSVRR